MLTWWSRSSTDEEEVAVQGRREGYVVGGEWFDGSGKQGLKATAPGDVRLWAFVEAKCLRCWGMRGF